MLWMYTRILHGWQCRVSEYVANIIIDVKIMICSHDTYLRLYNNNSYFEMLILFSFWLLTLHFRVFQTLFSVLQWDRMLWVYTRLLPYWQNGMWKWVLQFITYYHTGVCIIEAVYLLNMAVYFYGVIYQRHLVIQWVMQYFHFFSECAMHCSLCYNETECYECTHGFFLTENGECQRRLSFLLYQ